MKLAKVLGGLLLVAATGCTTRVTDFTVISTKNQSATAGYAVGSRTTGESCVTVIVFPLGQPNLKTAIDDAIEHAGPGFDALADGVVFFHNNSFLFGSECYEVQGTPINTKSKKTALLYPLHVWEHSSPVVSASRGQ